jgi:putative SOS response-associated peptidase YedK
MCGRSRQALMAVDVRAAAHRDAGVSCATWVGEVHYHPMENMCPGRPAAVVCVRSEGVQIATMRWGLVPSYETVPDHWKMFNARSETLSTSPVFSKHLGTMRCAAPLDGFFEWTDDKCKSVKSKQPYYVSRSDGQPLWMAGLFASPRSAKTGSGSADPCASGDESFTLITREVDPELAWLHDRMPVILDSQGLQAWLDPKASEPLAALSHRLPTSALRWHPVDKRMARLDYQESDVALPIKLISEQQRSVASFFGKISTALPQGGPYRRELPTALPTPSVKQEEATAPPVKQEATAPSESSSSSSAAAAAAAAAPSATAALLSPEVTAGSAGACSWVETGRSGKRPAPVSAASIPNKAAAKKPKVIAGAAKSKAAAATSLPIRSMLSASSATRFASARAELSAMGFSDADRVERALEASEGDIVAAVARLCSDI